jgi:hypothetical protein
MMSTEWSKHVERWNNKYIEKKCVKLLIDKNYKIPLLVYSDLIYAESKMQNKNLTKQSAWILLVCYSYNCYPLMYLMITLLSDWRELYLAVHKIWNPGESEHKIYAEYVRRIGESKGK